MKDDFKVNPSKTAPEIKVLMYHRVLPEGTKDREYRWSVSQNELRKHLWLLEKWGYTFISFQDHFLATTGRLLLPKKPAILTLDDGYNEIFYHALPILKDFGVRATVFVLGDRSVKTNRWDVSDGYPEVPLVDDDMLIELHKMGFEIGSHGMRHVDLTTIGRNDAWEEIAGSKSALEELIHAPVTTFAYPYGATNTDLERMVRTAGYDYGCGSFSGPPKFSTNLFNIRRIQVTSESNLLGFGIRMLTPYAYYRWIRWKTIRSSAHKTHTAVPLETKIEESVQSDMEHRRI